MSVWGNLEDAFTATGQPPQWKVDAIKELLSNGYQQAQPYAVGGGPEPAFVLVNPAYLINSDEANKSAYEGWLINQNIFTRTGVAGAVDTTIETIKTAAASHPQSFIALGVATLAIIIAWRMAK